MPSICSSAGSWTVSVARHHRPDDRAHGADRRQDQNFARKPEITRRAVCLAEVIDQSRMLVETRRKKLGVHLEVEAIPTGLAEFWPKRSNLSRSSSTSCSMPLMPWKRAKTAQSACLSSTTKNTCGLSLPIAGRADGGSPRASFRAVLHDQGSGQGLGLGLVISRMIAAELGAVLKPPITRAAVPRFTVTLEKA